MDVLPSKLTWLGKGRLAEFFHHRELFKIGHRENRPMFCSFNQRLTTIAKLLHYLSLLKSSVAISGTLYLDICVGNLSKSASASVHC